jgi:RNA polymerase sigma-70 factor (ECF subfamily)
MAEIALDYEHLSDVELARLVTQRDASAVRVITRRNNQRLYRAAWSVLRGRAEAEDAVQDAYLKALAAIGWVRRKVFALHLADTDRHKHRTRAQADRREAAAHFARTVGDRYRRLSGEANGRIGGVAIA